MISDGTLLLLAKYVCMNVLLTRKARGSRFARLASPGQRHRNSAGQSHPHRVVVNRGCCRSRGPGQTAERICVGTAPVAGDNGVHAACCMSPQGICQQMMCAAHVDDFFSLSKLSRVVPQEPRGNLYIVRIPVLQQQGAQRRVDPSSGRSKQELRGCSRGEVVPLTMSDSARVSGPTTPNRSRATGVAARVAARDHDITMTCTAASHSRNQGFCRKEAARGGCL